MGEARRKRGHPGTKPSAAGTRHPRDKVQWLPLEQLDVALELLRSMVGESRESVPLYSKLRGGSLDRALVDRMTKAFAERAEFLDIYREQLCRWECEPLTDLQRRRIEEARALVEEGTRLNQAFQDMAKRATPIEDIMEMSDFEVGLRVATGQMPRAGESLLEVPPPAPRPRGATSSEADDEEVPGLPAFRAEMTHAVDAYLAGVQRWAGEVADLGEERRAVGHRAAVVLLESLQELTRASEAEGVRVFNLMCMVQEWTAASQENHRFFAEGVLHAPDPKHRRGAIREIAEDMGLSPADRDALVGLLDASARLTFGEAFGPGIA